jgi:hypothetical protein
MGKLLALGTTAVALVAAGVALAASSHDTYTYSAKLTRAAEVPKPKAVPAAAKASFAASVTEGASGASMRWKLTFSRLSGKVVGAHIHRGKPGVAGPVLVPLCGPCTSGKAGTAKLTKAIARLLETGRAYVNVHTAKNAAGELRGQVKLLKKTSTDDGTTDPPADGGSGTGDGSGTGGGSDPPPGY